VHGRTASIWSMRATSSSVGSVETESAPGIRNLREKMSEPGLQERAEGGMSDSTNKVARSLNEGVYPRQRTRWSRRCVERVADSTFVLSRLRPLTRRPGGLLTGSYAY